MDSNIDKKLNNEAITYQADLDEVLTLLNHWIVNHASSESILWLESIKSSIAKNMNDYCFTAFSALSRYFDKKTIKLTSRDLDKAQSLRKNWRPMNWSTCQVARTLFILFLARQHLTNFKELLDKLFNAADLEELIALYQALPLFPLPEKFLLHGTNGIRSNMLSVFSAIALNNPYPEDYFDQTAWNQLILKAFFVESPIQDIVGLKRRANPTLAQMLINTARERASAKRPIAPELWYLVGMSIDKETLSILETTLYDKNPTLEKGALLAYSNSSLPEARSVLEKHPDLKQKITYDEVSQLREFAQNII